MSHDSTRKSSMESILLQLRKTKAIIMGELGKLVTFKVRKRSAGKTSGQALHHNV